MRWQVKHSLIFLAALFIGLLVGLFIGWLLGLNDAGLLVCGLLGSIGAVTVLWGVSFKRIEQIITWLSDEQAVAQIAAMPQTGAAGEIVRRMTKVLRYRDQQIEQGNERLTQLFATLQVAPIGIMLLDDRNRVIWGNINAAHYLELDFPRDYEQQITNLIRQPEFVDYLSHAEEGKRPPLRMHWGKSLQGVLLIQVIAYGQNKYQLVLVQDVAEQEVLNQVRQDFVANVSHEIRTPLTVLMGFIETMQQLPLSDEERARYLDLMAQQSGRIHRLINDLLVLAKLEGGRLPDMNSWTDVNDLITQVKQVASELSGGRHDLVFKVPDDLHDQIAGDASEILSALSNLLSNAIRYTPQGGRIEVSWRVHSSGRGHFIVKDNGQGISRAHLSRITERFYRVDQSRSQQTGGTGLGLSIVKHVMQRHNGRLKIESVEGEGSTFSLYFPASAIRHK